MINEIRADMGKPGVFDVHLTGLEREVPQSTGPRPVEYRNKYNKEATVV